MTTTRERWAEQNRHEGDRHRLFRAVAGGTDAESVLYPGSYCDLAPSFVWPTVTYVDVDRRAARFFADEAGVREIIHEQPDAPAEPRVHFVHADYTDPLDLGPVSVDLLISLYAGPISRHCTQHLRLGGSLLVNPSHGDVILATLDPRYALAGVVTSAKDDYRLTTGPLDDYLIPKKDIELTSELVDRTGRGVAYTKPAFAYLFRRVG